MPTTIWLTGVEEALLVEETAAEVRARLAESEDQAQLTVRRGDRVYEVWVNRAHVAYFAEVTPYGPQGS
jgi:hypothetical protein